MSNRGIGIPSPIILDILMKKITQQEKMAAIKASLLPGDELDPETLHMFREEDGEVVEYKFCLHCKTWKPLTEYFKCPASRDGLGSYCKECFRTYKQKSKKPLPVSAPISAVIEEPTPVVDDPIMRGNEYEEIEVLLNSLKEGDAQKDKEIKALREEKKILQEQAKDLTHLTDDQIKVVLSHNKIPNRFLFEAIARQTDDQFEFYAFDKTTGMTFPIKTRETVQPVSFRYGYVSTA